MATSQRWQPGGGILVAKRTDDNSTGPICILIRGQRRVAILSRIAQIEFEHSVDFTSFIGGKPWFGAKKRFHPLDFDSFYPNGIIHNDLRYSWHVSYGKSGSID